VSSCGQVVVYRRKVSLIVYYIKVLKVINTVIIRAAARLWKN